MSRFFTGMGITVTTCILMCAGFLLFNIQQVFGQDLEELHAPDLAGDLIWAQQIELQGDTLFVSASDFDSEEYEMVDGQIWQLVHNNGSWDYEKIIESPASPGAGFGFSLAVADSIMIIGAPRAENPDGLETGAAYVYYLEGDSWELGHTFQPDLLEDGARMGHAVAADSGRVMASAVEQPRYDLERVGRVFGYDLIRNTDEDPIESNLNVSLPSERERLGWAIDIRGKWALVTTQEAGLVIGPRNRAFIFEQSTVNTGWTVRQTFNKSVSNWVHFGEDVAISEHTAFVGHPREQYDDSENGVVYHYEGFRNGDDFEETGFIPPSAPQSFSSYGHAVSSYGNDVVAGGRFVVDHLQRTGNESDGYEWELSSSFSSDGGQTRRFAEAVDINDQFMVAAGFDGPDQVEDNRVVFWQYRDPATYAGPGTTEGPSGIKLYPAYPNPFNPETRIRFSLEEASHVRLEIYDVLGRQLAVLVDEPKSPGEHSVQFDARGLASGLYIYRLVSGNQVLSKSMTLVK